MGEFWRILAHIRIYKALLISTSTNFLQPSLKMLYTVHMQTVDTADFPCAHTVSGLQKSVTFCVKLHEYNFSYSGNYGVLSAWSSCPHCIQWLYLYLLACGLDKLSWTRQIYFYPHDAMLAWIGLLVVHSAQFHRMDGLCHMPLSLHLYIPYNITLFHFGFSHSGIKIKLNFLLQPKLSKNALNELMELI